MIYTLSALFWYVVDLLNDSSQTDSYFRKNLVSKFHRNGTELKILKTGEIANETGEPKEQLTVL